MRYGKAARWVGLVGGLGAVAWAMRERFVTLPLGREPEHPRFTLPPDQSPSDKPAATRTTPPDDLTAIAGVGPVFARRLMEAGIATFAELARAESGQVAGITSVSPARAGEWISQASKLV